MNNNVGGNRWSRLQPGFFHDWTVLGKYLTETFACGRGGDSESDKVVAM